MQYLHKVITETKDGLRDYYIWYNKNNFLYKATYKNLY